MTLQFIYFIFIFVLLLFEKLLGRRSWFQNFLFRRFVHLNIRVGLGCIFYYTNWFLLNIIQLYLLCIDFLQKFLKINLLTGVERVINKEFINPIFNLLNLLALKQFILSKLLVINLLESFIDSLQSFTRGSIVLFSGVKLLKKLFDLWYCCNGCFFKYLALNWHLVLIFQFIALRYLAYLWDWVSDLALTCAIRISEKLYSISVLELLCVWLFVVMKIYWEWYSSLHQVTVCFCVYCHVASLIQRDPFGPVENWFERQYQICWS